MKAIRILTVLLAICSLGACSNLSQQEQRMLSGGALGAVGGAALGAATGGSWIIGGLIGGGLGTAAGALIK
jgi:hypothetical protein